MQDDVDAFDLIQRTFDGRFAGPLDRLVRGIVTAAWRSKRLMPSARSVYKKRIRRR